MDAPVKGVLSEGDRRDVTRVAAPPLSSPLGRLLFGEPVERLRAAVAAGQPDRGGPGAPGMAPGTAAAPRIRAARGRRPGAPPRVGAVRPLIVLRIGASGGTRENVAVGRSSSLPTGFGRALASRVPSFPTPYASRATPDTGLDYGCRTGANS